MKDRIANYVENRADLWRPLHGEIPDTIERVIVIPALAERDTLPLTLMSLATCNPALLATTLVLIVINNRPPEHQDQDAITENQQTLQWLDTNPIPELHLAWIDASTPGQTLDHNDGVGSARRIGMDRAMQVLHESQSKVPLIICLDADSTVEPNYLDVLQIFAQSDSPWAGVIDYAHPITGDEQAQSAIVSYELFLRYMEFGLRYAQSPYAFHTVGSTMVSTPQAYAAVSGMNTKSAGEDFYFLQQLKKTGTITNIRNTTIHPSPRVSWRVPFGTGKRVQRYLEGPQEEWRVYHPETYRILKIWLAAVNNNADESIDTLLEHADDNEPELGRFLRHANFPHKWTKFTQQSSDEAQLIKNFHTWFDAFQTMKLTHHLRDTKYPEIHTIQAIETLNNHASYGWTIPRGANTDLAAQIDLLQQMRDFIPLLER